MGGEKGKKEKEGKEGFAIDPGYLDCNLCSLTI